MHIDLQPELVYQDDYLKVEVDERAKYIYVEWLQSPGNEEFRNSFRVAGMISLEKKCEYWLSDARPIPFLDFGDQNWILREMKPLLRTSSLKKYARLSSMESINLLDVDRIYSSLTEDAKGDLKTQFESFTNKQAALSWLFADFDQ
ncbi:hypothetical protein [Rufibacter hautae]|uniref:STAS/SEC14 domain-containing protein n=1 Tax=Rufibacter hautae TaxID=2595005 RepID=A0A5B6TLU6_9BACT|nr:hypothetical protein [Rufibacter hautae]KAA3437062.1 hypothetical protein FOA19_22080 [Rufibacter hautae]